MKKQLCIVLSVFVMYAAHAQNTSVIDDLLAKLNQNTKQDTAKVNVLLQLGQAYYRKDQQRMLECALQAKQLSEKLNYKKGLGGAYRFEAINEFLLGNFSKAEDYCLKALSLNKEVENNLGIAASLALLGNIYAIKNNYSKALDYYQKAARVNEILKNDLVAASIYVNMGVIYSELKNFDLAIKYFQTGLEIHTKIDNKLGIASSLGNIGNVYFDSKHYEKALDFSKKSLDKYIAINDKAGIAMAYGNIASVQIELKNYRESSENYNKSLEINEEIKNKKGIAVNLGGIGKNYLEQGNYKEALIFAKKANTLAASINVQNVQKETFEDMSRIYEKLGKTDSAFISYKKFIDIKDNIDNENNRKQISRLEIQYEFDNKEREYKNKQLLSNEKLNRQQLILALNKSKLNESNKERDLIQLNFLKTQAELQAEQTRKKIREKQMAFAEKEIQVKQKEIALNNLTIEAKEKQKWFLLTGLGLLGIIGGLLFFQSQNRRKTNEKLQLLNAELNQANQIKTRFFAILNHDLRSPLSNLIFFLQLQKESPEMLNEESRKRIQDKTTAGAENLLASMEDILLWSKGQMENFKPQPETIAIKTIFEDIQKHFSGEEKVNIRFENPENIQINTDENYLKTIIRNLTGNAIKAVEKIENPVIIWKTWQTNNQHFLSITDNGIGGTEDDFKALYDDKEVVGIKTGLGLHLIRDLAKAIHSKISVETLPGQGTTFLLTIYHL
jgi:signal transduction histidine kinase/TPR repeat protein